MSSFNITDESHIATLDAQLQDNLYIGGHQPNAEDALVFEQFKTSNTEPNQDNNINLWSWYALVTLFEEHVRNSWKASATVQKAAVEKKQAAPKKEEPKQEAAADDDDLFGDDNEEDAAALEALKKKKLDEKDNKKKEKPAIIAKSLVLIDVKVWDMEQNLDELAKRIIAIEKDGLFWKSEYKLSDVAFGVKKIVIGMVVEDEKISVEDIIDELQAWEDDIQSVDIVAFNKI